MPKAARRDVRARFADAGIKLWGLGTACEFHSPDRRVVAENIETCKRFIDLAADVGAVGVKVRPNRLLDDVPVERTLEQIGKALRQCGQAAQAKGIEVWLEVHGAGTSHPPHVHTMLQHADHPQVGANWNSNPTDLKDGSVRDYFQLLQPYLRSCHINELTSDYPWRELFALLSAARYDRFTLAEIGGLNATDPQDIQRFMCYYRSLWEELSRVG